jgi:hypothetical protein
MTRAHHTQAHRSARTPRSRPRKVAPSSALPKPPSDAASSSPSGDHGPAGPTHHAPRPGAPRIGDALALCGLLLSTLPPSVVLEFLTKIANYGADIILAICQSAQRTAERTNHPAVAPAVRGAGPSRRRRGRASRTTSRP